MQEVKIKQKQVQGKTSKLSKNQTHNQKLLDRKLKEFKKTTKEEEKKAETTNSKVSDSQRTFSGNIFKRIFSRIKGQETETTKSKTLREADSVEERKS